MVYLWQWSVINTSRKSKIISTSSAFASQQIISDQAIMGNKGVLVIPRGHTLHLASPPLMTLNTTLEDRMQPKKKSTIITLPSWEKILLENKIHPYARKITTKALPNCAINVSLKKPWSVLLIYSSSNYLFGIP